MSCIKIFLENKLMKMISKGNLSKESIIKVGKAGMIPSKRKTVTGILKGTDNIMKKSGATVIPVPVDNLRNSIFKWTTQSHMFKNNNPIITVPQKHTKLQGISDRRHEAYESLFHKFKKTRDGMIHNDADPVKIINPENNEVVPSNHAGVQVLKDEKEILDKIIQTYPNTKLARAAQSKYNYRIKSGEYPYINKLDTSKKIRNANKLKKAWDD